MVVARSAHRPAGHVGGERVGAFSAERVRERQYAMIRRGRFQNVGVVAQQSAQPLLVEGSDRLIS